MSYADTCSRTSRRLVAAVCALLAFSLAGCASVGSRGGDTAQEPVPEFADRMFQAALEDMRAGRMEAAQARLETLTSEFPTLPGPWVNLGIVHAQAERDDEALASFQTATEVAPGFPAAGNQMGMLLRRMGRFEEADQAYAQALEADPDYALAHLNRGVLLDMYMGQPIEALKHFERYLELTGTDEGQVNKWVAELRLRIKAAEGRERVAER